jgi:uncharacterized protein (DUF58 family)
VSLLSSIPELIHYYVKWRANGLRAGAHVGRIAGAGSRFRGHGPLLDNPDPRRIDVRATARDPYRRLLVKMYQQNVSLPVWVVADWSASMAFQGEPGTNEGAGSQVAIAARQASDRGDVNKVAVIADLCEQLAWSTWRMADRLGFIACNEGVVRELHVPARCSRLQGNDIRQRLAQASAPQGSAQGLVSAAAEIGRERALVFLVTDAHYPLNELQKVLQSLSGHDVVPVVLWNSAEYSDLPRWGFARFRDAETRQERLLWCRPRLQQTIHAAYEARRQAISEVCAQWGRLPFFISDRLQARALTHYFMESAR